MRCASPVDHQSRGRCWFSLMQKSIRRGRRIRVSGSGPVSVAGPLGKRVSGYPGNDLTLTTQFSQFNLSPALMARLNANKFETPTPVQLDCIPPALEGRDVLATAQTGTGKTLGYLIPIVEMLLKIKDRNAAQALILLPTRELAI